MRYAVDVRILEFPCPTGVDRVATEVLRALPALLAPGDELLLLGRGLVPPPSGPRPNVRSIALGGPEAPLLWRESHLSPAVREHEVSVLWSPVAALPVRPGVPCVATIHEVPWLVRPWMEGALREQAHRLRIRIAVSVATLIVCPSLSAAAQVTEIHPEAAPRLRVVPLGVPEVFFAAQDPVAAAEFRHRLGVAGPYLLHVGGTRPRKNVPLLLRAYARYLLRGGRSSLVMAGPGDPPAKPPRGVQHLGYVSDESLLALYDGASMLVISSDSEGFGIPVIEAMARGTPVVTTTAGGLPETAGGAATLVPRGDDEALAAAMLETERDAAVRADLVARGRVRAAQCRFGQSAALLHKVLVEAAG